MPDDRLTPRQQLLAAAAIGSLALAGSIGAMQAGRGQCAPIADPSARGGVIAPLDLDTSRLSVAPDALESP